MLHHFADRLAAAVTESASPVCVGLDPTLDRIAHALNLSLEHVATSPAAAADTIWRFNQRILQAVRPYCAVVKPQSAFYERWGPPGVEALQRTIEVCRQMGLICLVDAKRNDIASTAAAYAQAYLGDGPLSADALTVNPYLGADGIDPFLQEARGRSKGIFALVKTSNPSSVQIQDQPLQSGRLLYEHVGDLVEEWGRASVGECGYSDVGAVVGATFPGELSALRQRMPHTWFLMPGYGSQGGTASDVVAGFDRRGLGAVVNSSRGIIYAWTPDSAETDFAEAAAKAARKMRDAIVAAREERDG
jgi:orotidine-5'-phosphate decarboxylase